MLLKPVILSWDHIKSALDVGIQKPILIIRWPWIGIFGSGGQAVQAIEPTSVNDRLRMDRQGVQGQ